MQRQWFRHLGIFVLCGVFFFIVFQQTPWFPDPDSFYHAKMAVLIRDQGIIREFPYLQASVLKNIYVDHHFLYHVLLIPFVTISNPLLGIKVATALFAAGAVTMLYALLRIFAIPYPFLWVGAAFSSTQFVYRLNLAKAPGISVFFLLLGTWLLIKATQAHTKRQNIILHSIFFNLNFLYVWLYSAWPFLMTLTVIYAIVSYAFHKTIPLRILASGGGGIIAGLLLNPYFPDNIRFAWWQIVQIGLVNYHSSLNVGTEWYPYSLRALFAVNFVPLLLTMLDFVLLGMMFKRWRSTGQFLAYLHREARYVVAWAAATVMTIILIAATLKARRNIEYLVPFQVLAAALGISLWKKALEIRFLPRLKEVVQLSYLRLVILCVLFWLAISLLTITVARNGGVIVAKMGSGFHLEQFRKPALWLRTHTPVGSVVFLSDWGEFPLYFYWNDRNYYLDGLDPTFTYLQDPERARLLEEVRRGKSGKHAVEILKNDFNVSYAVIPVGHHLVNVLDQSPQVKVRYQYEKGAIYQIQ